MVKLGVSRFFSILTGAFGLFLFGAISPIKAETLVDSHQWKLAVSGGGKAEQQSVVPEDLPPGAHNGVRITVVHESQPFYLIMLSAVPRSSVPQDHQIRLSFWARSPSQNALRAVIEKSTAPYTTVTDRQIVLSKTWIRYELTGQAPDWGESGIGVRLQFGYASGIVDFADMNFEDLGPDLTMIEAQKSTSDEAVNARIEQYRKGDLQVTLKDQKGNPITGAAITVTQQSHDFLFGCNIFLLQPDNQEPWQLEYQKRFAALFNYATLPFYWGSMEKVRGNPDYLRLDNLISWCKKNRIQVKGHPLVWQQVWPAWAPTDQDQARPILEQRVTQIIRRFSGSISIWDVQNEANSAGAYDKTGIGDWVLKSGPAQVVATTLGWARQASQGSPTVLIYNDYNIGDANANLLNQLQAQGRLPDAIGLQSHMHTSLWPMTKVWQVAQRFGSFGKPLHFTETTVMSCPVQPTLDYQKPPTDLGTTDEGERLQAEYVTRFYALLFSHPAVRAITWWDFSDRGAWLNAPSGLLRKDMTPKPAYDALFDLVHKRWWSDVQGKTDDQGSCRFRVFYGTYRVTAVTASGQKVQQEVQFPNGSSGKQLVLNLP